MVRLTSDFTPEQVRKMLDNLKMDTKLLDGTTEHELNLLAEYCKVVMF
jgi:hypothetical protein